MARSVSLQSALLHNTSYLTPGFYPDPVWFSISYLPTRLVLALHSETRFHKQGVSSSNSFRLSLESHFTQESFCFALRSPSIVRFTLSSALQSCVSDLPDSHASCGDVNCWLVTSLHAPGIMYGQHSADFLSLPPLCAGPGVTSDDQERAGAGLSPLTGIRAVH